MLQPADVPLDDFFAPLPPPLPPSEHKNEKSFGAACDVKIYRDPYNIFTNSEFAPDERPLFPFSSHPLIGRLSPGGATAGLSERQQMRLSVRWSWDMFKELQKKEGFNQ